MSLAQAGMAWSLDMPSDHLVSEKTTQCHEAPQKAESETCCECECLTHCSSSSVIFSALFQPLAAYQHSAFESWLLVQAKRFFPAIFIVPPIIR